MTLTEIVGGGVCERDSGRGRWVDRRTDGDRMKGTDRSYERDRREQNNVAGLRCSFWKMSPHLP